MKPKMTVKITADILMTALMLFLMGYHLWGDTAHEWVGAGIFVLFILHHILNFGWYKNLFRKKYGPVRILQTAVDISVFAAMLGLMISGVILSRKVFAFLPIKGGMAFARTLHIAATHWGFVLMSLHLGLHWGMFVGLAKKAAGLNKPSRVRGIICFLTAAAIAAYGIYVFISRDFPDYMTLKTKFAFLDYGESKVRFYLDYAALMGAFVFIGHYAVRLLGLSGRKSS